MKRTGGGTELRTWDGERKRTKARKRKGPKNYGQSVFDPKTRMRQQDVFLKAAFGQVARNQGRGGGSEKGPGISATGSQKGA